jgi:hypothetical protein
MTQNARIRPVRIVVAVGLLVVLGWSLQPASAHIGTPSHLWTQHLRSMADARYLQNTRVFVSSAFTVGALGDHEETVDCPAGWQAIGGGVDFVTANANVRVVSSAPIVLDANLFQADDGRNPWATGWRVTVSNLGVTGVDGKAAAICTR